MKYLLLLFLLCNNPLFAQIKRYVSTEDSVYFVNTKFRLVGPFRGGRATAVCGSLQNKQLFYMGSTGGGVWKTNDGGQSWSNISDKYFGGTIGSIALAPQNENIIYVGEGENTMRGNVSEGIKGMWKSENGGLTWKNIGLSFARHITRIIVHPHDNNTVWAAVNGSVFGPSKERGVYKTTDGGKTWKQVLYSGNPQAGAIEITMHPKDVNVLYASTWNFKRTPYSMESGGEGSAIWKSMDGGESWTNVTRKKGLPTDSILGISHVAFSASTPSIIYLIIEAKEKGGLYRSDDDGESWTLQSQEANIRQRAWYFSKIAVDPDNPDLVYACNVELWKSDNGGKNWTAISTPHGDHHNLWIDPFDSKRMIVADDGGAQISFNGGERWSAYHNQATAQIYRLSTDNHFPYHLLGSQQDNTSVRILSRTKGGRISEFKATAGGEAGYDVADPLNPDIVYGGEYAGVLRRMDHHSGEIRHINVWPEINIGSGAENLKYRFQWNYPLFFSPHNPHKLYAAGNCLFATEDEGLSWKVLSPDLTTNNKEKQKASGGPITKDNTTAEYYCTIFTATESAIQKDLLYTGSDDGLLHKSENGGARWTNITPSMAPKNILWNCIETDQFNAGSVYVVGTCYKDNDFKPYIYYSTDYGNSWTNISKGIPSDHFARCIRADHVRRGLLYVGTEYGMYISYDYGASWRKFQLNLPEVPITDLCIKNNDLCVATQGRSIWILDDLSKVQSYDNSLLNKSLHVFPINAAYRTEGYNAGQSSHAGENPDNGVVVHFWVNKKIDSLVYAIKIFDKNQNCVKEWKSSEADQKKLSLESGMNKIVWDMYYKGVEELKDMVLWNGQIAQGPKAIPANYTCRVIAGNDSIDRPFAILPDPNYNCDQVCYEKQFDFLMRVMKKFETVQKGIKQIRETKTQLNVLKSRADKKTDSVLVSKIDYVLKSVDSVEQELYQTKAKSGQDLLNYPIKLNDKISALFNMSNDGYALPTQSSEEVFGLLSIAADKEMTRLEKLKKVNILEINNIVKKSNINYIHLNED